MDTSRIVINRKAQNVRALIKSNVLPELTDDILYNMSYVLETVIENITVDTYRDIHPVLVLNTDGITSVLPPYTELYTLTGVSSHIGIVTEVGRYGDVCLVKDGQEIQQHEAMSYGIDFYHSVSVSSYAGLVELIKTLVSDTRRTISDTDLQIFRCMFDYAVIGLATIITELDIFVSFDIESTQTHYKLYDKKINIFADIVRGVVLGWNL